MPGSCCECKLVTYLLPTTADGPLNRMARHLVNNEKFSVVYVVIEAALLLLQVPMAAQALPKKKSIVYEVCTQIFLIVICVLLIMAFLPLVTT